MLKMGLAGLAVAAIATMTFTAPADAQSRRYRYSGDGYQYGYQYQGQSQYAIGQGRDARIQTRMTAAGRVTRAPAATTSLGTTIAECRAVRTATRPG